MNNDIDRESRRLRGYDLSDTGQWRLIIYLSKTGMSAWLKSTEDPTIPVGLLFTSSWNPDSEGLLGRIQNAVYDHPRVLDDFSADIIVETQRALWVPKELAGEHPEEECEKWFAQVWPGMETEFMTDECGDKLCLHMLVKGLKDFLARTFPGTRIRSHQTLLVKHLSGRAADDIRFYIDIREREADMVLFSGKNLLHCSTHGWEEETDIIWHVFNTLEVYGIDPAKAQVCLSGLRRERESIGRRMREYLSYVMLTMVPKIDTTSPLPLAALFCAARNNFLDNHENENNQR